MAKWVVKTAEDYRYAFTQINASVNELANRAWGLSLIGAFHWAVEVMGEAMDLAPVDTGHLRDSAYVYLEVDGDVAAYSLAGVTQTLNSLPSSIGSAKITVGFSAEYAFVQHEHIEFNHPLGGQAKYLETAIDRLKPALQTMIRKALGGV